MTLDASIHHKPFDVSYSTVIKWQQKKVTSKINNIRKTPSCDVPQYLSRAAHGENKDNRLPASGKHLTLLT